MFDSFRHTIIIPRGATATPPVFLYVAGVAGIGDAGVEIAKEPNAVAGVFSRVNREAQDGRKWDEHDDPVEELHGGLTVSVRGVQSRRCQGRQPATRRARGARHGRIAV